jgi:integrase
LTPYLAERESKEFIFSPEKERAIRRAMAQRKTDKPVRQFAEKYSSRLYYAAVARAIKRHNAKASEPIPHWFPYQLRHAKATEARANGEIETAQILLGHSNINMTEIYAKKNKDLAIQHAIKNC